MQEQCVCAQEKSAETKEKAAGITAADYISKVHHDLTEIQIRGQEEKLQYAKTGQLVIDLSEGDIADVSLPALGALVKVVELTRHQERDTLVPLHYVAEVIKTSAKQAYRLLWELLGRGIGCTEENQMLFGKTLIQLPWTREPRVNPGWIYAISRPQDRAIKIGYAANVPGRLSHLRGTRAVEGRDLTLVGVAYTGGMERAEALAHYHFHRCRQGRSEWFDVTPGQVAEYFNEQFDYAYVKRTGGINA